MNTQQQDNTAKQFTNYKYERKKQEPEEKSNFQIIKDTLQAKSQIFFLVLGILTLLQLPYQIKQIYEIRQYLFERYPQRQKWPEIIDFKWCVVGAVLTYVIHEILNYFLYDFFYRHCREKNNEKIRLGKVQKAVKSFFKTCYYITCVVWGYILLKDEYFMPKQLGCNGDVTKIESRFGYYEGPKNFEIYYLGTMGFHVFSMLQHTTHKARNDFVEMLVHHGVAVLLYGISFLTNRIECGLLVMFLHDLADIPVSSLRCFSETDFRPITIVCVFSTIAAWGYTRVLVYPYTIYCMYQTECYEYKYPIVSNCNVVFLIALFVLHVYWYSLMLGSALKYCRLGNLDDPQQKIRSKEKEQ